MFLRVRMEISAHFRRPAETSMPRSSSMSSSVSDWASFSDIPVIFSVSMEAPACEMAQPVPSKVAFSMMLSPLRRRKIVNLSPQRGLHSLPILVGESIFSLLRGFLK